MRIFYDDHVPLNICLFPNNTEYQEVRRVLRTGAVDKDDPRSPLNDSTVFRFSRVTSSTGLSFVLCVHPHHGVRKFFCLECTWVSLLSE